MNKIKVLKKNYTIDMQKQTNENINMQEISIKTYNKLNFKSNYQYIKLLIGNNDICFFIEHWLNNDNVF